MANKKFLLPWEAGEIIDLLCDWYNVPHTSTGRLGAMGFALQFGLLKFNGLPRKQGRKRGSFKPDRKLKDPKGTIRRRKLRSGK
jgi:hypothetical protein